jgi:hypothetical protein
LPLEEVNESRICVIEKKMSFINITPFNNHFIIVLRKNLLYNFLEGSFMSLRWAFQSANVLKSSLSWKVGCVHFISFT